MDFLLIFLFLVVGVLLLGKGSDWLTQSLIPLSRKLGVSTVSVGLIVVSVAVSLPEILVAVTFSAKGHQAISLGVVLGSIVCNIGLMTGLCAIIRPLKVSTHLILRDGIFSLIVPILVMAVCYRGQVSRFEGLAFFLLFIPYAVNVFLLEKRRRRGQLEHDRRELAVEMELAGFTFGKVKPGWISFLLGLALLLLGSQIFSDQLIALATAIGGNELLLGATLGALGPSIPNITAAYAATKKGMGEIAVSETLGSNIFTLLVTLGISAMISPLTISRQWIVFDLPALFGMSLLLFTFLLTRKEISRLEGSILLGSYVCVMGLQVLLIAF